ncbi:MAG TPA: ABC transporter ATP-binding protein [Actinomycetota bacterium]|nr:ABC transporter ATP-binding protein [Actinomycetota bacterium]
MIEPAIETISLGKVYAGGVRALDEVSFQAGYGEVFAYLGRNGSGKTTTIRMLTTLTAATTGTARVAGHDVARDPAAVRRAIGVTMQHAALDETMTGRELLGFLAALWELPRSAAAARIGEVVDRLGLGGVLDRRIATYSGGTRRRLDLAGALLHRPAVLFLDEPSTGLDPQSRRALWEQVRELRDQGSAIFLTTQYLEEAAQLADRIAVLHGGRLAAEDTPDGLRRGRGGLRLRVRVDQHPDQQGWLTRPVASAGQAHQVLDGLVAAGAAIAEFHLDEPTLEDAYLALTGTDPSPAPPAAMAAVPA